MIQLFRLRYIRYAVNFIDYLKYIKAFTARALAYIVSSLDIVWYPMLDYVY